MLSAYTLPPRVYIRVDLPFCWEAAFRNVSRGCGLVKWDAS